MQIEVAELWPKPPASGIPTSVKVDGGPVPWEAVLFLPIPRAAQLSRLDLLVHELSPAARRSVNAVIVRPHPEDLNALRSDPSIAKSLQERVEGRPCYTAEIIAGSHRFPPFGHTGQVLEEHRNGLVHCLRHAELMNLTNRPSVVLPRVEAFHYEGPNGTHYRSFLRPGMALQSPAAVEAVVFWLLPRVAPDTVVLLDTWSMMSLGYALQIEAAGRIKRVTSVERYDESTGEILRRVMGRDAKPPTRLLILVSVSSTGALAARLKQACAALGGTSVDVVSLYSSAPPADAGVGEAFCRVGSEFRRVSVADCEACRFRVPLVRIDPGTYLLEISAAAERAAVVNVVSAKEAIEFFERYSGSGCVSLHRTDPHTKRHHMIHIDVERLLTNESFRERLNGRLQRVRGRINAVICPSHSAAVGLAEAVVEALGLNRDKMVVADEAAIASLPAAQRHLIETSREVVIIDDVTITGHRLRGFRHALINAGLAGPAYHFLVGVQRTWDKASLLGIKDMAHRPGSFLPVEDLILPNWNESECPWCWELSRLKAAASQKSGLSDAMAARFNALRDTTKGLSRDVFLHWGDDGARPQELGPQSAFGDLDGEVEVFTTIASSLQQLRSTGKLSERFMTPIAKVLEPQRTVQGRFYVPVITASILRAARLHDLRSTASDDGLEAEFRDRLVVEDQRMLRSEILVAVARGLLPRFIDDGQLNAALHGGEEGVATFLRTILERGNG